MNQLAYIALRLFALHLIITSLSHLVIIPAIYHAYLQNPENSFLLFDLLNIFTPLLAGAIVWRCSCQLSLWLSSDYKSEPLQSVTDKQLVSASTFILGLYFFIDGILKAYPSLKAFIITPEFLDKSLQQHQITASILQLVMGVLVMMGQKYLISMYSRFRRF